MTEQQNTEAPMAPQLPPGRPKDERLHWSDEQRAVLEQVRALSAGAKVIKWSRLFADHPEWKDILLEGGRRPMFHLWHVSRALLGSAAIPDSPYKAKELPVVRSLSRRKSSKRGKTTAWWAKQGKPHPLSREGRALREANRPTMPAEVAEHTQQKASDFINFCPKCGHGLAAYKRADQLMSGLAK